jgi:hypothetical protein
MATSADPQPGPQPGDYVRHPYGRGRQSTSRVKSTDADTVTVTRRGKNYTYPRGQVSRTVTGENR